MNRIELSKLSVPQKRYVQQLNDINWTFKADNIRKRDNHKCRICGTSHTQLDVHHLRYIDGKEPWDYDDGDLVTLCHSCHEKIHRLSFFKDLSAGDYFYNEILQGVGIVEKVQEEELWFSVCWTDDQHWQYDNHGRLFLQAEVPYFKVRKPTTEEIDEFWYNVTKYYSQQETVSLLAESRLSPLNTSNGLFKDLINKYSNK